MTAIINATLVMRDHLIPGGVLLMEDGKITEVQLYPVTLNMEKSRAQKGRPVMNKSEKTLKYLAELSEPYGTNIEIKDGVGYIRF